MNLPIPRSWSLLACALLFAGCNTQEKLEKVAKAEKDAAFIMANLDKEAVLSHFPAASFPANQVGTLKAIVADAGTKCDWQGKRGKFVDLCTISENGNDGIAYIYEYFLKCDSLRFIMLYNLESKEPQLVKFLVEPLEKPNSLIIYPEKQLLPPKKTL
jgi:hypothetical protein